MKICGVPDCGVLHYAKGWCKRHWRHSERYEGWTPEAAARMDAEAGFISGITPVAEAVKRKRNASASARRTANYEVALARERKKREAVRASIPADKRRAQHRRYKGLPEPTRPESGACECCGKSALLDGLCLDHDHVTGKFRGWLCNFCNTAIGKLGDSLDGVKRAVAYLEKFG